MKGKTIVVFGAHPDDPDFGSGATVAKYVSEGATAYYVVCTDGSRGSRDHKVEHDLLIEERHQEQKAAADKIGVKEIIFLNHEDGTLNADINFKEEIVKVIRKLKPDLVITHDPAWFYVPEAGFGTAEDGTKYSFVNHSDHRQTGIAVLDAVYPLARDLSSFPKHIKEGLETHKVHEVYLNTFTNPNFYVDVSDTLDTKISAILEHKSQVDDPDYVKNTVTNRAIEMGKKAGVQYAEGFIRLLLR